MSATLAISVPSATLSAQVVNVGETTVVARAPAPQSFFEPHLAVHPSNDRHLIAVTVIETPAPTFAERSRANRCAAFTSLDGGVIWTRHDFPLTYCYDPWVVFTPDGHAVFAALAAHPALPHQPRGLVVYHSPDGGRTWVEPPVGLGTGHDHETIAVDLTSTARRGWLYVVSGNQIRGENGRRRFSIFVARSRTNGRTFDAPVRVVPSNLHNLPEMPVVLSDGTLIISYVDAAWNVDDFQSRAGGLERRRGWVLRSTDGGATFSMPLFATEACGPPKFQLSALAADLSAGPFRDRLYFACRRFGGGAIALSASPDAGEQWTEPVFVHQGPPDTAVYREKPALAVNSRGLLAVAWIEAPPTTGQPCGLVYLSASLDGGRTFLPERPIMSPPSCWDSGDYFGLVALSDGRFRLLWTERRNEARQLSTAVVDVKADPRRQR